MTNLAKKEETTKQKQPFVDHDFNEKAGGSGRTFDNEFEANHFLQECLKSGKIAHLTKVVNYQDRDLHVIWGGDAFKPRVIKCEINKGAKPYLLHYLVTVYND